MNYKYMKESEEEIISTWRAV